MQRHECNKELFILIYNLIEFYSFQKSGRYKPTDCRMSPDLLRGTGKSIGGDLDVDDEGNEQHRFEPMESLHHSSVG
jgi:hypothetical protein